MEASSVSPVEDPPASQSENLRILLRLMDIVAADFGSSTMATRRAWGKHLREDRKSLQLMESQSPSVESDSVA